MARLWSYFFLLMPLITLALFAVAPYLGWSLPENVSALGAEIDFLYRVILFVTGTVFLGTQFFLFYIVLRFGDREGRTATYTHGSKRAEAIWTLIPAAIIAGIAAMQMPTWWKLQETPSPGENVLARVTGRRFAWEVRHAGADGVIDTIDDIVLDNELHMPPGRRVWIELTSRDVIHSFFVANMRMKQDTIPGMRITIPLDSQKSTLAFRESNADFKITDVEDSIGFMGKLRSSARKVDQFMRERMPASVKSAIEGDSKSPLTLAQTTELAATLNAILKDTKISNEIAFLETAKSNTRLFALKHAAQYPQVVRRMLIADAYPGIIRQQHTDYDIVCAELCGDGHFQMLGKVIVHESDADYQEWLKSALKKHPQEVGQ